MNDGHRFRIILLALACAPTALALAAPAITVISPASDDRREAAIAFGADGRPVLSYVTALSGGGFNLVVRRCASADCSAPGTAANAIGASQSLTHGTIAIPADDRPMMAFLANGKPRWLRCGNPACTAGNVVEERPGTTLPDMVLRNGNPIVVSTDGASVRVFECQNPQCSSFATHSVPLPSGSASVAAIALGTDNLPILAVSQRDVGLSVAKCLSPSCASTTGLRLIDPLGPHGVRPRLAAGSDGSVVVAYTEGGDESQAGREVRVARCADAACGQGASIHAVGFAVDDGVSLALRPGNLPLVSYRRQRLGSPALGLAVAACRTPTCASDAPTSIVDPATDRGRRSAIAIDAAARPVIAYEDEQNLLAFARCDVPDCRGDTPIAAPGQSGEPLAFVVNRDDRSLLLADTVARSFVGLVPLGGKQSGGIAFTRDGKSAFVVLVDPDPPEIVEIDIRQRSIERRIALPQDSDPGGLVLSPDGKRLYVALGGSGLIAVLDRASGQLLTLVPAGGTPVMLAVTSDGRHLVAGVATPDSVRIIDTASNTPVGTLPLPGNEPTQVVVAPDDSKAYVGVANAVGVAVVDLAARVFLDPIPLAGGAGGVALTQDGRRLYVGASNGSIASFDPVTRTPLPAFAAPGPSRIRSLALAPDERTLVAIDESGAGTLALLDAATGELLQRIELQDDDARAYGNFVSPRRIEAREAVEFFHAGFGHYFTTILANEIEALDTGVIAGWARTGETFTVLETGSGAAEVCRFFTVAFAPKSSHFYTPLANECDDVKANPDWIFEAIAYEITLPVDQACSPPTVPLFRLYNDGKGGAPNHRYTTKPSLRDQMIAAGFVLEGVTGCVPK